MTETHIHTARTLSAALPYLQRYDGAVIVVKFGGHAMANPATVAGFARDIVLMRQIGINCLIVHGGGPKINDTLTSLGVKSSFINGNRVSDAKTVDVAEMVLSGSINKGLVQAINREGGRAIGISGKDANILICDYADESLGLVGKPVETNTGALHTLLDGGFIPVMAPVGVSRDWQTLNVNADTVAGAVASALKADRLLLLTDVDGVLDENGHILSHLTQEEVEHYTLDGLIRGGMIPKTRTAMEAVSNGVRAAVILNGTIPNALLLELFTDEGVGTLISDHAARAGRKSPANPGLRNPPGAPTVDSACGD
ncbi:MAG: acetylglutamate kinase [Rhodobacteraceae bacterium]|nr:acetylglutamate kinase [Paracoccaceae bacterium]